MSRVHDAVRQHAQTAPQHVAVSDDTRAITYGELVNEVERVALLLREIVPDGGAIALLADNGADWVVTDLAALLGEIPVVPIPLFFSAAQIEHTLYRAGVGLIITDRPDLISNALRLDGSPTTSIVGNLVGFHLPGTKGEATRLQRGTQKVTFTSGTTGDPKGVCLSAAQIEITAESLRLACAASRDDKHLCALPLATLLENVGGLFTPLLAGATICVPPLARIGLSGSSGLDIGRLIGAFNEWAPTSAILVPQMLEAIVQAVHCGLQHPNTFRYLAVGGAPIARRTLDLAEQLDLPVYEGYGLSECGSVIALNQEHARRAGSVGKPLPHTRVTIAADGEILVSGAAWLGYVGEPTQPMDHVATGDLGRFDEEGFLYVTGRKKSIFITSFGRNVAPEWVERELVARPPIVQAAIFGEARPFNTAIIVARAGATEQTIALALDDVNKTLPDYAQVRAWVRARDPFSVQNGMSTSNGRLRRTSIYDAYADQIATIYQHRENATNELFLQTQ